MLPNNKSHRKGKVFPKGQIVIPAELRKQYNIHIGDQVDFVLSNEGILLKPASKYHREKTSAENLLQFFKDLENGEIRVELKLIVLFQTLFVLKSFYKVPKESIAESLLELIEFKGLFIKNKKNVKRMLNFWSEKNLDIVDCYLIANLEGDKQNILYSYDKDFDKFGIKRKEP